MDTLQHAPGFVDRLEAFRSEVLGRLDHADKKTHAAATAAMDELLDPAVGLNNFVVPDMLIPNTRAGLYVYLNAAVGPAPQALYSLSLPCSDWRGLRGKRLLTRGLARWTAGS